MNPNLCLGWTSVLFVATASPVAAVEIQIDYTYDTHHFFDTDEKRAVIEAVADFYGSIIADHLLRIDPADFQSASWTPQFFDPSSGEWISGSPGLVVPENTMIIYVGGQSLPSQISGQGGPGGYIASGFSGWFDRLNARGNTGALAVPASDFAPWGGSISFNNSVAWNFSLEENQPGREFVSVALHEIGHVLGIGTAPSWKTQVSGGRFNGEAAARSHGTTPPADEFHLLPDGPTLHSKLFGSFGVTHGQSRPALMLPASTDTGSNFDVATDLDLACLVDIGWEILPAPKLHTSALSPAAAAFSWPSVSFLEYRVERGTDLATFPDGSSILPGNGGFLAWTDPTPPASRAFYRMKASAIPPTAAAQMEADDIPDKRQIPAPGGVMTQEIIYPWVTNCICPSH